MRVLFGCCLFFLLNIGIAKPLSLELLINGEKLSLPYWESQIKTREGSILIVQGEGESGDSLFLAQLARMLSKSGWSVALLIAKQADSSNQEDPAWLKLLPEVLSELRKKNSKKVVLLHYGAQLQALLSYFNKLQAKQVNGLILLSAFDQTGIKEQAASIQKLPFPLLDLTGQFDYDTVLDQASQRSEGMKNKAYLYVQLPGADHNYIYSSQMLSAYLHGWMIKLRSVSRVKPPIVLGS